MQYFFFIRVLFLRYYVQLREKGFLKIVKAHAIIRHACFFSLCSTLGQRLIALSIPVITEQVAVVHVEEHILRTELQPTNYLRLQQITLQHIPLPTEVHRSKCRLRLPKHRLHHLTHIRSHFVGKMVLAEIVPEDRPRATEFFALHAL